MSVEVRMNKVSAFGFCIALMVGSNSAWTHPGTLDGKAELDFVKTQLAQKAEPYTFEFTTMKNDDGGLAKAPAGQTTINANANSADLARNDARRTYGNALAWYLTGDETYAKRAVQFLNAWSGLQSITATDEQNRLVGGWLGSLFAPAADIMLGYSGWASADVEKFRAMFKRAFYPVLNTPSTWNGNVDLHQISAMMAIAVFCEDSTEFKAGIARLADRMPKYFYITSDPKPTGDWFSPLKWVDGLTQETCRDNNHHAQFGLSGAVGAMETAYHQGVDLYSMYQNRIVSTMELMGLQCSSGDMQGVALNNTTTSDVYDTWEIGFNHYHNRKGISMPNTETMITEKVRSAQSNGGSWSIFYESLTHADIATSIVSNSSSSIQQVKLAGSTIQFAPALENQPKLVKLFGLNGKVLFQQSLTGSSFVLPESIAKGVNICSVLVNGTVLFSAKIVR